MCDQLDLAIDRRLGIAFDSCVSDVNELYLKGGITNDLRFFGVKGGIGLYKEKRKGCFS